VLGPWSLADAGHQVKKLISGQRVYICGDFVTKSVAIFEDRPDRDTFSLRDREDYSDDELLDDEIPRVAATTANVEADLRARVDELR
jgi:hypothetical protein